MKISFRCVDLLQRLCQRVLTETNFCFFFSGRVVVMTICALYISIFQAGGYKFRSMSGWNGTIRSRSAFQFITHSLNPLKHDDWRRN